MFLGEFLEGAVGAFAELVEVPDDRELSRPGRELPGLSDCLVKH